MVDIIETDEQRMRRPDPDPTNATMALVDNRIASVMQLIKVREEVNQTRFLAMDKRGPALSAPRTNPLGAIIRDMVAATSPSPHPKSKTASPGWSDRICCARYRTPRTASKLATPSKYEVSTCAFSVFPESMNRLWAGFVIGEHIVNCGG